MSEEGRNLTTMRGDGQTGYKIPWPNLPSAGVNQNRPKEMNTISPTSLRSTYQKWLTARNNVKNLIPSLSSEISRTDAWR